MDKTNPWLEGIIKLSGSGIEGGSNQLPGFCSGPLFLFMQQPQYKTRDWVVGTIVVTLAIIGLIKVLNLIWRAVE